MKVIEWWEWWSDEDGDEEMKSDESIFFPMRLELEGGGKPGVDDMDRWWKPLNNLFEKTHLFSGNSDISDVK